MTDNFLKSLESRVKQWAGEVFDKRKNELTVVETVETPPFPARI